MQDYTQFSLLDYLSDDDPMKIALAPKKSNDWKWTMKDDYPKEKNGLNVFSCFACGGGQQWDTNLLGVKSLGVVR